jgi:hypothetical protein
MKELNAIASAYFTLCIAAINSQRPNPRVQGRCYRYFYHQLLYPAASGILHTPLFPTRGSVCPVAVIAGLTTWFFPSKRADYPFSQALFSYN